MGSAADTSNAPSDKPDRGSDDDRSRADKDDFDQAQADVGSLASTNAAHAADSLDTEEEDQGGFLDRAGDFFGGLAEDAQDFARENPRVDSHGDPVGLIDANGIQRGEVASGALSSGTSSEELAEQLGFSSPQEMAAAQSTDFIDDKYREDVERRAIEEALDARYGHPSRSAGIDFSPDALGFAPQVEPLIDETVFDLTDFESTPNATLGYFGTGYVPAAQPAIAPEVDNGILDGVIDFGIDLGTRTLGLAQAAGGVAEMGVGGLLSTTGLGSVAGIPLGLHGADTYRAGVGTWLSGEFQPTLTEQFLQERLSGVGIHPGIAGPAAITVDALIGMTNPGAALRNTGELAMRQMAGQVVPEMVARHLTRNDYVVTVNPSELNFSQTTAGRNSRYGPLRDSMLNEGWNWSKPPIEVVRLSNGALVTLDNTRPAIARELGISEIPAHVHDTYELASPSDLIAPSGRPRFGLDAKTWGDMAEFRGRRQSPRLDLSGTHQTPELPKPKDD